MLGLEGLRRSKKKRELEVVWAQFADVYVYTIFFYSKWDVLLRHRVETTIRKF